MLRAMAAKVEGYVGLDSRWIFPLGYSVVAAKPAADGADDGAVDGDWPVDRQAARAAAGLGAARRFVTLCFASDLLADPRLLSSYAAPLHRRRRRDAGDLCAAHRPGRRRRAAGRARADARARSAASRRT